MVVNILELIEGIKQVDEVKNNLLPEDIECKNWYIQRPAEEDDNESESISFDAPDKVMPSNASQDVAEAIDSGVKCNSISSFDFIYLILMKFILDFILVLGRIFKRLGANVENKQLDSNKSTLSMTITNELINNNIHISSDDLQSFIELYLARKRDAGIIFVINFICIF